MLTFSQVMKVRHLLVLKSIPPFGQSVYQFVFPFWETYLQKTNNLV